jgi:hypothetical protein
MPSSPSLPRAALHIIALSRSITKRLNRPGEAIRANQGRKHASIGSLYCLIRTASKAFVWTLALVRELA